MKMMHLLNIELQIVYDWAILDRQEVGRRLVVDEKPYKQFIKTIRANVPTALAAGISDSIGSVSEEELNETKENLNNIDIGGNIQTTPEVDRGDRTPAEDFGGGEINPLNLSFGGLEREPVESPFPTARPESQIDFESMSAPNPDSSSTPIEYIDESYRPATPSPLVTQPETQYSTNQAPSEPSVRSSYGEEIARINQIRKEAAKKNQRRSRLIINKEV